MLHEISLEIRMLVVEFMMLPDISLQIIILVIELFMLKLWTLYEKTMNLYAKILFLKLYVEVFYVFIIEFILDMS